MIESARGNQIIFDGKVKLARHDDHVKCRKQHEQLTFVQHLPAIRMSGLETRLNVSGVSLFMEKIRIEITGQA